jgi:queuine tRNA-ribosyltransferase
MKFNVIAKDKLSSARAGVIKTSNGLIETPVFMPVGTSATVKAVHQRELKNDINPDIILGNTYHLYLRPGIKTIEKAGGLAKFMNWNKPILTDSGGYQVYSLSSNRKIKDNGVKFKSHIDGSYNFFTPENVIEIQRSIGADIIMAFDECPPYTSNYIYNKESMERTHRWLDRCLIHNDNLSYKHEWSQTLFPIVQGSTNKDLRKISANYIAEKNCKGNAIGGLSVGEPAEEMYEMTDVVCSILPEDKPRYLMGVGTPINIIENISLGVDMFDCVIPTRNARNGMLFTSNGTINIKNKKWKNDFSPLDNNNYTFVDYEYSKAYLRHLFSINEILGKQIASIHNLGFYIWLLRESRKHILAGSFSSWKSKMIVKMNNRL